MIKNKYSRKRLKAVDDSIRELSKESQKVQRSFWDILLESIILNLDIKGKVIQDTDNNKEIISGLGNIIDPEIRSGQGRSFLTWYVDALQNISDLNGNYFKKLSKEYEQKLIDDELGKLLSLLGINGNKIKSGSYLDNLIDFSSVYNKVQGNLIGNIITNQPIDIQGNKDYILGTNPKEKGQSKTEPAVQVNRSGGAIEGAISQKTFDSFQTFDRTISSSVAGALNLNYAIYQGGLIKTSRAFCIERNNRVFSRAEIEKFGTKDDQFGGYENKSIGYFLGKSDPYNPVVSLGGYNCRHHWDWISDELAGLLREEKREIIPEKPEPKLIHKDAKTIKEAERILQEHFQKLGYNSNSVKYSKKLTIDQVNARNKHLSNLLSEYKINASDGINVVSKSKPRQFGYVKYDRTGKIGEVNFGDRVDQSRIKGVEGIDDVFKFKQEFYKSRVDPENLELSTLTHEFGHFISLSISAKDGQFWGELKKLYSEYMKEIRENGNDLKSFKDIFISGYASTNYDEFLAEAFTEYKLRKKPSKYSNLVGQLIDKYFKR